MACVRGVVFMGDDSIFERGLGEGGFEAGFAPTKRPGLDDLLEYLGDCVMPAAVVTYGPRALMEAALAQAGVAGTVCVVVPMAQAGEGRADVAALGEATLLLGTEPQQTLAVVRATPQKVGVLAAGLVPAVVDDLGDVIDLVEDDRA